MPDANKKLSPERMSKIVEELRNQPAWRLEAAKCCSYYESNQLTAEELQLLEERGAGPIIVNLIGPAIDIMLGTEAKSRTDPIVTVDDPEMSDMADALSVKLKEAARESYADVAISEAYAGEIKAGLHWVGVSRSPDPFQYPYRVEAIHRDEVWWDWAARRSDLSDARYLVRQRWVPIEEMVSLFPEQEALIRAAGGGWSPMWMDLAVQSEPLMHAFDQERSLTWDDEWRNLDSGMVLPREIWFRESVRVEVLDLPDGRVVEYDPQNEVHVLAVTQGVVAPRMAPTTRLYLSIWLGPHCLAETQWKGTRFPYVPFWGYREDKSRVPFGKIRAAIPLQDEVNSRRRKLHHLLSSKRVFADSDALDTNYNDLSDLAREVARPDAAIVTNPNRRRDNAIKVESDLALSTQQYQVMMQSEEGIQKVMGVFNAMMGRESASSSGLAINSLVEQGNTTQGDINDNYRFARRMVFDLLLELLVEDMIGRPVEVIIGEKSRQKKVILNQPVQDPQTGVQYLNNDVSRVIYKTALSEVPSTPSFRQQSHIMMAEVMKALPPQMQAPLMPFFIEGSEMPNRTEMADVLRKVLGLGDGAQEDPRLGQMQATIQQLQAVIQQGAQQYEGQIASLTEEIKGLTEKLNNKDQEIQIKASQAEADVALKEAQAKKVRADTAATVLSAGRQAMTPVNPTPQGMTPA